MAFCIWYLPYKIKGILKTPICSHSLLLTRSQWLLFSSFLLKPINQLRETSLWTQFWLGKYHLSIPCERMFLFSLTCLAMAKAYCSISKDTLCDDLDSPHFFARLLDGGLYPCAITFVSTSYNKLKFNISLMIQVEKSIDHYRFIHLFVAEQIGSTLAMTLVIPLCIGIHQIVAFLSNMHGSLFAQETHPRYSITWFGVT